MSVAPVPLRPTATMIPSLNSDGVLPPGIFDCTIDEIETRFGQFDRTDRRPTLVSRLRAYLDAARRVGLIKHVIVDGSFITNKPEPGDIDIVVGLDSDTELDPATLRPFELNVITHDVIRRSFPFDVVVAPVGSGMYEKGVAFYRQVKGLPGREKGLLRVTP